MRSRSSRRPFAAAVRSAVVRSAVAAVVGVVVLLAAGCASTVQPGTGDVSFRLRWDGTADLDLHVVDPVGRHVGVEQPGLGVDHAAHQADVESWRAAAEAHPDVPAGILDVDCNADPERACPRPIENVYWPTGTAPRGTYRVWVRWFQDVYSQEPAAYVLEVRRGEQVVERFEGVVGVGVERSEVFEYVY